MRNLAMQPFLPSSVQIVFWLSTIYSIDCKGLVRFCKVLYRTPMTFWFAVSATPPQFLKLAECVILAGLYEAANIHSALQLTVTV
jgi:hypothetical protein